MHACDFLKKKKTLTNWLVLPKCRVDTSICDTWPPHGFEQNSLQNLFRLRTNTQYLVVNRYQWDTSPENPSMKPS